MHCIFSYRPISNNTESHRSLPAYTRLWLGLHCLKTTELFDQIVYDLPVNVSIYQCNLDGFNKQNLI